MELLYLVIFIIWVLGIIFFKKHSAYALVPAFLLFLVSAFFTVFNLSVIAEPIMRVSFIGWIIGVFGALIEYKKFKESSENSNRS